MARKWHGTWSGGRTAIVGGDFNGRLVYVLEKQFKGRRYTFVLGTDPDFAVGALFNWGQDPLAFIEAWEAKQRRARGLVQGAVYLTTEVLEGLRGEMEARKLSQKHVRNTLSYLRQWREDLGRHDLRRVEKLQLTKALAKRKSARKSRIVALKTLCAWLVGQGQLEAAVSPARHLTVPPAVPERAIRTKGYTAAACSRAYAQINPLTSRPPGQMDRGGRPAAPDTAQAVRDVFRLQLQGLHGTEVARIGAGQAVLRALPLGAIAGTVTFRHKNGEAHTVSLDPWGFAAAVRLQTRGKAPADGVVRRYLRAACKRIGLPPMDPGELRHTTVTLAREGGTLVSNGPGGLDLLAIADVTGHKSTRTTARFYDGAAVPKMLVLPQLKLVHAEDPTPIALAKRGASGGE